MSDGVLRAVFLSSDARKWLEKSRKSHHLIVPGSI